MSLMVLYRPALVVNESWLADLMEWELDLELEDLLAVSLAVLMDLEFVGRQELLE